MSSRHYRDGRCWQWEVVAPLEEGEGGLAAALEEGEKNEEERSKGNPRVGFIYVREGTHT